MFEHLFVGSTSFFLGCLLSGIFLSKLSSERIRSPVGRIRNMRCVFVTLSSITLFGSLMLIWLKSIDDLHAVYVELAIYITQMGIAATLVTVPVSVIIIVSVSHRVKVFAIMGIIQMLVIAIFPVLMMVKSIHTPAVICLISQSSLAIVLSLLIRGWTGTSVTAGEVYHDSEGSDSQYDVPI